MCVCVCVCVCAHVCVGKSLDFKTRLPVIMNLKNFPEIQIPVPKLDPWNQSLQFWNQESVFLKCCQRILPSEHRMAPVNRKQETNDSSAVTDTNANS